MPRLPKGIFKRRGSRSYYTKARIRGKGVWRSLGPDREEAVRKYRLIQLRGGLRRWLELGEEEIPGKAAQETVAEVGEKWLSEYVATRRNERGCRLARTRFERYLAPILGDLRIEEVKPEHLRQVRLRIEKCSLSPQTVTHILSDARCLFRYATDELRLIAKSPFPPRLLPKIQESPPRRLSTEEISTVLDSVPPEHAFVVHLALSTGLRWGEVHRLKWKDIDWSGPWFVIEHTKSRKIRRVPIARNLVPALRERFAQSKSVYISPFRCKWSGSFNRQIQRRTRVKTFGFHQLRHTFACDFLEAGGSKEALKEILGHSTIRLTERYGRVSDVFVKLEAEGVAAGVAAKYGHAVSSLNAKRQQAVIQ